MIFLQPVLAVGQQEMNDFILAIIEAQGVPCRMLMFLTRIEELVGVTSQVAQSFHLILDSMRMNDVHDDSHPVLVSLVDESL